MRERSTEEYKKAVLRKLLSTDLSARQFAIEEGIAFSTLHKWKSTRLTINAMANHGVKRLICQSTLGAQESWANLNFFWKRIMFGAIIRPIFKDHEAQEKLVQNSSLDRTIVRPSAFRNYPAGDNFQVDVPPTQTGLKLVIGKGDIAKFIIRQLQDDRFMYKAVGISC